MEPLFAEFRPDVVHINGVPLMAAGLVTHRSGIPLVWHVRETLSKNLWGRLAGFALPRIAQALVAVSKDAADHIDRSRGNVHVIHNGVDAERCRPGISGEASRAELGIPASSPCIGFVGNMIFTKGIQDFISAAPTILELRPDDFLLVGSGKPEFLEQLRESMVRTGCQEQFHLTGQRGDVPELVAAMDVLALPSLEEGLSRAVVEAMAMEKPVVTTSIPSNREVIVTGESGLLVEPHDPPSLAAGVLRFLADGELARRCGTAARRVVLADFSIEAHVDKLDRLYDQVAKKIHRRRSRMNDLFAFLPTAYMIGAAKSGTTSLYALLNEHPKITFPARKEPFFSAPTRSTRKACSGTRITSSRVPTGSRCALTGLPGIYTGAKRWRRG